MNDAANVNGNTILVLQKALRILGLFTPEQPEWRSSQISDSVGIPLSTVGRILSNLVDGGLLRRDGDVYRVSSGAFRLARAAVEGQSFAKALGPIVERVRDETDETTSFYIQEGATRLCMVVSEAKQLLMRRLWVGHSLPINAGAPGKVLLAYSSEARKALESVGSVSFTEATIIDREELEVELDGIAARGYAVSEGEWHAELSGVAAPVFGERGLLAGALGVSVPSIRLTSETRETFIRAVVEGARDASRLLGYSLEPPPEAFRRQSS